MAVVLVRRVMAVVMMVMWVAWGLALLMGMGQLAQTLPLVVRVLWARPVPLGMGEQSL